MKVLRCRDVGERTCNYQVQGETTEDVERKLLDHTGQMHWWVIEGFDQEERRHFFEQMDAMIEDVK
jgi:predicted small metal-binding protein